MSKIKGKGKEKEPPLSNPNDDGHESRTDAVPSHAFSKSETTPRSSPLYSPPSSKPSTSSTFSMSFASSTSSTSSSSPRTTTAARASLQPVVSKRLLSSPPAKEARFSFKKVRIEEASEEEKMDVDVDSAMELGLERDVGPNSHSFSTTPAALEHAKRRLTESGMAKAAEAGSEKNQIADLWMETHVKEKLLERDQMRAAISQNSPSDIEHLLAIVNTSNAIYPRVPLKATSSVALYLADDATVLGALLNFSAEGGRFRPEDYPTVFIEEKEGVGLRGTRNHATHYLRGIETTVAEARMFWTALGERRPSMRAEVAVALRELEGLGDVERWTIWYAGVSVRGNGFDRCAEDARNATSTLRQGFMGATNAPIPRIWRSLFDESVTQVGGRGRIWDTMAHEETSRLEELMVAVVGASSLNSSRGGFGRSWDPSLELLKLRNAVSDLCTSIHPTDPSTTPPFDALLSPSSLGKPPLPITPRQPLRPPASYSNRLFFTKPSLHHPPLHQPTLPSRTQSSQTPPHLSAEQRRECADSMYRTAQRHLSDSRAYWKRESVGETISEDGFNDCLLVGGAISVTTNGYPFRLRIANDVPMSEFRGNSTYYGNDAGDAPRSQRVTLAHAWDLPPDQFDATIPRNIERSVLAESFGSLVNLWGLNLEHNDLVAAALFLIRFLLIVDCVAVVISSGAVASFLSKGKLLEAMRPEASDESLDLFFNRLDSTALTEIRTHTGFGDVEKYSAAEFTKSVGDLVVIPILRGNVSRLGLTQLDAGVLKYDPKVEPLRRNLVFLVELKARIMYEVIAERCPDSTVEALAAVKDLIEERCHGCGLSKKLEIARSALVEASSALGNLRFRGGESQAVAKAVDSRLEDLEDEEFTRAEVEELVKKERSQSRAVHMSIKIQKINSEGEKALGAQHSPERLRRKLEHLAEFHDLRLRGLSGGVPSPPGVEVGSADWHLWYDGMEEGISVDLSARGRRARTFVAPAVVESDQTTGQAGADRGQIRESIRTTNLAARNSHELSLSSIVTTLSQPIKVGPSYTGSRRYHQCFECLDCGGRFFGLSEQFAHLDCPSRSSDKRPRLRSTTPLFPPAALSHIGYDLRVDLFDPDLERLLKSWGLSRRLARECLPAEFVKNLPNFVDPYILVSASTTNDFACEMAVDECLRRLYSPGELAEDDAHWWSKVAKRVKAWRDITNLMVEGKEESLVVRKCGDCGSVQIAVFDGSDEWQHECDFGVEGAKKKTRKSGTTRFPRLDTALSLPPPFLRRVFHGSWYRGDKVWSRSSGEPNDAKGTGKAADKMVSLKPDDRWRLVGWKSKLGKNAGV